MKFTVEMLAFGRPGEVREVDCPNLLGHPNPESLIGKYSPELDKEILDSWLFDVFYYGQNERQPQPHPSVSAGDVIHIGEDKWLVMAVGFKKLTPEDYLWYKGLPRDERIMVPFTLKP